MEVIDDLYKAYGVNMPEQALTPLQWDIAGRMLQEHPLPGEIKVTSPRDMRDIVTGRPIRVAQYEAGVAGWQIFLNEWEDRPYLIPPPDWYSAQFQARAGNNLLPHFLKFNGGRSAIQYNWRTERTFLEPSLQDTLPSVDVLNLSGTWIKTRFLGRESGFYRPSRVAIDLGYDSNGLPPENARDQVTQRLHLSLNIPERTYRWEEGQNNGTKPHPLTTGHTVIKTGRSTDTYRRPSIIHMFVQDDDSRLILRINPDHNQWQTDLSIPFEIEIPHCPSIEEMTGEVLGGWVDQHRNLY